MNENPFAERQKWFGLFLRLALLPPGVHLLFALIFGMEADTSWMMLLATVMGAGAVGSFLGKWNHGPVVSTLAAIWPAALAVSQRWHWGLGMRSPGGAASTLARILLRADVPAPAAVSALLAPFAIGGWLFSRLDMAPKRRGRSRR